MDDKPDNFDIPEDIITSETPTFIIRLLAFQHGTVEPPWDIDALCEALARQEKLLAAYGLTVAGAIVSRVPSEGAGVLFAESNEIEMVTPLS